MKVPNKFWFYHNSDKSIIYFAEGDEYEYIISGSNMKNITITTNLVESFIDVGDWVLAAPSKFKVRGVLTDTIYSVIKDANNLYVMTGGQITYPSFHYKEEVLDALYGENHRWEVYTEDKADIVKEKPSVKKLISINVNSVRAAAEFDVANNKHTIKNGLSVEEIEQEILKYVREMYSGLISGEFEWRYRVIGTRSYVVRFRAEDENYGVISVEVDPSIGMPSFYASVEDFINQN